MPTIAEAYALGLQHHRSGNLQLAEQFYRQILQADPRHVDTLHQLGIIAYQVGRYDLAHEYIGEALRVQPGYAEALNSMGIILRAQGKLEEAAACLRQSLNFKANNPQAHSNLGVAFNELGKLDEAVASFRQALLLNPDFAEARNNLGNALQKLGLFDEAAASLREAVRLRPNYAEGHNNLGLVLTQMNLPDQAIACFQQALQLKPDYADAHSNMGCVLAKDGRYDEAIACFQKALALKPGFAEACNHLGYAFYLTGRRREAEDYYVRTLDIEPDHAGAHLNRAILWLQRGDYEHGWPEYEWRYRHKDFSPRTFPQPRWQGEPLAGKTILLHAEQGLGDTLHFVRYAPLVKERSGAAVLLQCQTGLLPLLSRCHGIDRVLGQDEPLPAFDVQAPLLSLPFLLGTRSLEDIPAKVPYLEAEPALVERWRDRLEERMGERERGRGREGERGRRGEGKTGSENSGSDDSLSPPVPLSPSPFLPVSRSSMRVGIVWQGNPENKRDRWRSVPLEKFALLARVPGVSLISLQIGAGREDLRARPGLAVDVDFDPAESGAVMKNLDLVITVDTAPAHLAGGLGVPTWVLLPHVPDWRWLLERADSPWYPSVRLFRQARPHDWDEVFGRVKSALEGTSRRRT